jgi:hypothetical protein
LGKDYSHSGKAKLLVMMVARRSYRSAKWEVGSGHGKQLIIFN